MSAAPPPPLDGEGRTVSQVIRSLAPSIYIPTLLQFIGVAALMPVITLLALELGFATAQAASLTVVFGLAAFLGPIPAGRLIGRIGARAALVATGLLLVIASMAGYAVLTPALADDVEAGAGARTMLIGVLVMMAACSQVWMLGRQSFLGSALPPSMRARGMTMFGGMIRVGQVIGPLAGAVVLAAGSLTGVFVLNAAMTLAATVMVAVFLPAGEVRAAPVRRHHREHVGRSPARIRLTRAVLARMLIVGLGIMPVMIARVNNPVIIPLLGAGLGLDAFWISIVFGISAVVDIALVVPAGVLMDRYGRAAVAVPCATIMGLGYLALALATGGAAGHGFTPALLALLLPAMVIALGNGLGSGIVMTLGIDVSPVHGRTRYLSWWNTLVGAGRLVAPLLVAGIVVVAPVGAASATIGVLCLGGAAHLGRVLPRTTPRGSRQAPRPDRRARTDRYELTGTSPSGPSTRTARSPLTRPERAPAGPPRPSDRVPRPG